MKEYEGGREVPLTLSTKCVQEFLTVKPLEVTLQEKPRFMAPSSRDQMYRL